MTPVMVRADGVDWTLDRYIGAYRLIESHGEAPDFARSAIRIDGVYDDGATFQRVEASEVMWCYVKGWKTSDFDEGFVCYGCGDVCSGEERHYLHLGDQPVCFDCWTDGEY